MIGGSSGSRFVVNFSIEGTGERDLSRIAGMFKDIQTTTATSGGGVAAGMGQMNVQMGRTSNAASAAAGHMSGFGAQAMVGLEAMEKLGEAGATLVEAGGSILEVWSQGFEILLHKGAEFESLILRIQGSGKTHGEAVAMTERALEITKQLPITEMEAARMVQVFATAHVDATARIGESYDALAQKGKGLKGLDEVLSPDQMKTMGATAASMTTDLLSSLGHLGTGYQRQATHEILQTLETGRILSRVTFAGLGNDLAKFKQEMKSATTMDDRLIRLQKFLADRGTLGISNAAMNTWGGVMSNFAGIVDQLVYIIDEPGKKGGFLNRVTMAMKGLYESLKVYFDSGTALGRAFQGTLRDVASMMAGGITTAIKTFGTALRGVLNFIADNPGLTKLLAGLSIAGSVVLIAAGAFATLSAVLGGLVLSLIAMPELLLAPLAILGAFPFLIGYITAALAVGAVMYAAWQHDLGGIRTLFENIGVVVSAVRDALSHWNGSMTAITEESRDALEERGLMGSFLKVVNIIRQAEMFYEGFMAGFGDQWDKVSYKFSAALTTFDGAMNRIGGAVRAILQAFGILTSTGSDAVQDATTQGMAWGVSVAEVADTIAELSEKVAYWVDAAIASTPALIEQFAVWYQEILEIKLAATLMFDEMVYGVTLAATAFAVLMTFVAPLAHLMAGIAEAAYDFATADFKGAGKALYESITAAGESAIKYQKMAIDENEASVRAKKEVVATEKRIADGEPQNEADELRRTAKNLYNGSTPFPQPTVIGGAPPDPDTWGKLNQDEVAAMTANARQNQPRQTTIVVQVDRREIGRAVHMEDDSAHEQGGGHPVTP